VTQLDVEIWAANTSQDGNWAGRYAGHAGTAPVWSTSVSFSSGSANVVWDGRDASNVPVPSGEYVVWAEVGYAGGVDAVYLEPAIPTAVVVNTVIAGGSVGASGGADFDPYYGETVDVSYTLSRAAWITMGHRISQGMMAKLLHGPGTHEFAWDGRNLSEQGLAYGDSAEGTTRTLDVLIKATKSPPSLMHVRNTSLEIDALLVEPIVIHPIYGQTARIGYTLNRDSLVTIRVYDTVSGGLGTLFQTIDSDVSRTAGSYTFAFDGLSSAGEYPAAPGTYSVEIIAKDPTHTSYATSARRLVRLMQ
jgi:flagellar hook assembly protein FlgD